MPQDSSDLKDNQPTNQLNTKQFIIQKIKKKKQ